MFFFPETYVLVIHFLVPCFLKETWYALKFLPKYIAGKFEADFSL